MKKRHWNTPETEGMTDREYAHWVTERRRRSAGYAAQVRRDMAMDRPNLFPARAS